MNEKTSTSSKKRKTLSAILAVAMVLTMLLSGTLAYFYQAKAINLLTGGGNKAVIGHDDFDNRGYTTANAQGKYIANKDVYVENVGDTSVWVRIKLEEGLTKDGEVIQSLTSPTAHTVNYNATDATPENGVASGKVNGKSHQDTFHGKDGFKWTMGGEATKVLLNKDDQITNMTDKPEGVYIDESNGAPVAHDDYGNGKAMSGAVTKDTPKCKVISMGEYKAMPQYPDADNPTAPAQTTYIGWVGDNNGYYYWSQMLEPGDVTGLLLDQVEVLSAMTPYEYNIHVTFQAVDKTDRNLWHPDTRTRTHEYENGTELVYLDGASSDAWKLMDNAEYNATGQKTDIQRLEENRDNALANKKYGAAKAYDMAAQQIAGKAYMMQFPDASELEKIGDSLMEETDRSVIAIFDEMNNTAANRITETSASAENQNYITDPALARAITAVYGSKKNVDMVTGAIVDTGGESKFVLTKDELKAVTSIVLNMQYGQVQNFSSLTAAKCPNFSSIYMNTYSFKSATGKTGIAELDTIDASILPKIKNLLLESIGKKADVDITTIDLTGFPNLEYLSLYKSTAFENVTVPASKLKGLELEKSAVKQLKTNVGTDEEDDAYNVMHLEKLQFLAAGKGVSKYNGFDQLTNLVYVFLGSGQNTSLGNQNLDFSKSLNLYCLHLQPPMAESTVKVTKTAFNKKNALSLHTITNRWSGKTDDRDGYLNLGGNRTISRVDISEFTCKFATLQLGAEMSSLKTVVRRSDQHEFTSYPTGTVVYEKVVGVNGAETKYYKHEGTKSTLEKDSTNFDTADTEAKTGKVFPIA